MTNTTHRESASGQGAGEAAREAGDRARSMVETGKEEAGRIADDVKDQSSRLVDETRRRTKDRMDSQVHHVATMLEDMSGDLSRMADDARPDSPLGSIARDGATAARSVARRLENDGLDGVADEIRRFARRRPGVFLAGAFGVGLLAGRLVRNADVGAIAHDGNGQAKSHPRQVESQRDSGSSQLVGSSSGTFPAQMQSGAGAGWDTQGGAR